MRILNLIITILLIMSGCAYAEIPKKLAIKAIIGEASGEGFVGMRCVASAIRNRGTLKGVYGLHAKHVNKQPKWVWKMARKAWKDSKTKDYVSGSSFWEGTKFKKPYWASDMQVVMVVGNQRFYKERTIK